MSRQAVHPGTEKRRAPALAGDLTARPLWMRGICRTRMSCRPEAVSHLEIAFSNDDREAHRDWAILRIDPHEQRSLSRPRGRDPARHQTKAKSQEASLKAKDLIEKTGVRGRPPAKP